MQIGRLASETGFSRDTIRYYEKIGLIGLKPSNGHSSYKDYGEDIKEKLLTIKQLKTFGFTLREMKWMFSYESAGLLSCQDMTTVADKKIAEIDEQIKRLSLVRKRLVKGIKECDGDCDEVLTNIADRTNC